MFTKQNHDTQLFQNTRNTVNSGAQVKVARRFMNPLCMHMYQKDYKGVIDDMQISDYDKIMLCSRRGENDRMLIRI